MTNYVPPIPPAQPRFHAWPAVARLGLASLLLTAAVLKAHQLATEPVVSTGFFGSRLFLSLAVEIEACLALWLASGAYPALAGAVSTACFALFAGISLWKVTKGEASCGCFGRLPTPPWASLTVDLLALPVSAWIAIVSRRTSARHQKARLAILLTLIVLAGGPSFWLIAFHGPQAKPDVNLVVLDPSKWMGKPWLLGQFIDIWPKLEKGRWAVLLYAPHCEECQQTVRDYAALAYKWSGRGDGARIALVATTPDVPSEDLGAILDNSPATRGNLGGPSDWFIPTPTLVVLVDGQILHVAEGEEDCKWDEQIHRKW